MLKAATKSIDAGVGRDDAFVDSGAVETLVVLLLQLLLQMLSFLLLLLFLALRLRPLRAP